MIIHRWFDKNLLFAAETLFPDPKTCPGATCGVAKIKHKMVVSNNANLSS